MSLKSINGQFFDEKKSRYGFFHTYEYFDLDGFSRKLKVLLPLEYKDTASRYSVIYMNDGNTIFDAGGLTPWSWNVHKSIRLLIKQNRIEPVIVVAVWPIDRNYEYLSVKRYHEWSGEIIHGGGGLKDYAKYLVYSLKPFIDSSYRTNHLANKTTIVGSSFGGLASLYISAVYNSAFGMAGIFSPAFFEILNQHIKIEHNRYLQKIINSIKKAPVKPKLWIDWGEDEGLDEPEVSALSKKVVKVFQRTLGYRLGKDLICLKDDKGTHDERAWEFRFRLMLEMFYSVDLIEA